MTKERLLELAWSGALNNWYFEHEKLEKCPNNKIAKYREEKYKNEMDEIATMINELRKENK